MESIVLKGHSAVKGVAEGEALVSPGMICFSFDVDVATGVIHDPISTVKGQSLAGKVFVFPTSRGSTTGPYGLYLLCRSGNCPKAIISVQPDPMAIAGAMLSGIPLMYGLDQDPMTVIKSGNHVKVDSDNGIVVVTKKA
jgi:predicted aconitase with swiveling domain